MENSKGLSEEPIKIAPSSGNREHLDLEGRGGVEKLHLAVNEEVTLEMWNLLYECNKNVIE